MTLAGFTQPSAPVRRRCMRTRGAHCPAPPSMRGVQVSTAVARCRPHRPLIQGHPATLEPRFSAQLWPPPAMKQQISVVSPRESMIMSQVIRSLADRVVCVPVFFNRTKLALIIPADMVDHLAAGLDRRHCAEPGDLRRTDRARQHVHRPELSAFRCAWMQKPGATSQRREPPWCGSPARGDRPHVGVCRVAVAAITASRCRAGARPSRARTRGRRGRRTGTAASSGQCSAAA